MYFPPLLIERIYKWFYVYAMAKCMVYIMDDDVEFALSECRYLEPSGIDAKTFAELSFLKESMSTRECDLLILNPSLSVSDGYLYLRRLREKSSLPVIITSSRSSESDRILGFELGCDDYLIKPFSLKELVLRIKALLRRTEKSSDERKESQYSMDGSYLTLDYVAHRLERDGVRKEFTAAEWKIIHLLVSNAGSVISRGQIMDTCFGYSSESYDRVVDTHIKNIRQKLGSDGRLWIETIRGCGYRFAGLEER